MLQEIQLQNIIQLLTVQLIFYTKGILMFLHTASCMNTKNNIISYEYVQVLIYKQHFSQEKLFV